jgi:hypothetical protein
VKRRTYQTRRLPKYSDTLERWRVLRMPKELTNCPRCGSNEIRLSHSRWILDFFFREFLDRVPFRCRNCRRRVHLRPQLSKVLNDAAAVRR